MSTHVNINNFPWGRVIGVHEVGEYTIVEFEPKRSVNVSVEDFDPSPKFHPYIDGKDTNHSYESLDSALVGVIALKYDGNNTRADRYFKRAIQMGGQS